MKKFTLLLLIVAITVSGQKVTLETLKQKEIQQKQREQVLLKNIKSNNDSIKSLINSNKEIITSKLPDATPDPNIIVYVKKSKPIIIIKLDTLWREPTCTVILPKPEPPPMKNVLAVPKKIPKKKVFFIFKKK